MRCVRCVFNDKKSFNIAHHVAHEFLKHVLIAHDVVLGGVSVSDVSEDTERLLLHLHRVVALKDENHRLHDLRSVVPHDVVYVLRI